MTSRTKHTDRSVVDYFDVLSCRIAALDIPRTTRIIAEWIRDEEQQYISVCTSDTILKCCDDPTLAAAINGAAIAVPDGMPLVWLGRRAGKDVGRVYGPDLMLALCEQGVSRGYRHYFFGSTPEVLADLQTTLTTRFPGINIAGAYSPPFHALNSNDEKEIANAINDAGADIVWVGLGTPKQDFWVSRFRPRLNASVLIPVGAAFAFHAGHIKQAPRWMMPLGLEWLFRLLSEPRRLWRRYLIGIPRFMYHVIKEKTAGAKRGETPTLCEQVPNTGTTAKALPRVNVLGVGIHAISLDQAVAHVIESAAAKRGGYVCVTGVHGVIESQQDPHLRRIHNRSMLTVPDGMPTVWIGKWRGFGNMTRVYGPDLMMGVCRGSCGEKTSRPLRHYLCGATQEVLDRLTANLEARLPDLEIVGTFAPPFRPLTAEEEEEIALDVTMRQADILWVGLSTPKQEHFMANLSPLLPETVMLGVGAAFDLHTGLRSDSPDWLKRRGLQWLHRLCQEPRRLWRRYLRIVPTFLFLVFLQAFHLKRFAPPEEDA